MLSNIYISWLFVLAFGLLSAAAPTSAPDLVPYIRNDGFVLEPTISGYSFTITKPDLSCRDELVVEKPPGQLQVYGVVGQIFTDKYKGKLDVFYEAGPNGYVAKYTYVSGTDFGIALSISPSLAKSLAG